MNVFVLVAVSLFSLPVRGQAPSSAVLPESLQLVFGQAAETRYVPRVRAIHELPANLTAEQVNACYEFLNRKLASQPLPDLEFNGLKNELEVIRKA